MMRYYEILPKQYEIIDQIKDEKITIERYTEIIGEILQMNNSLNRSRKDEDETNGEIESDLPIKEVTESGLAYNAVVQDIDNRSDGIKVSDQVYGHICVDSGATGDIIGKIDAQRSQNILEVDDITLVGIGGESDVNKAGDCIYTDELSTEQGIINGASDMTCLSVSDRCKKGWIFWAKDRVAQFISPTEKEYNFTEQDGLYKLNRDTEDEDTKHIRQAWMNKAIKNAKRPNMNAMAYIVMILLAMLTNMPAIGAIPSMHYILNNSKENSAEDSIRKNRAKKDRTDT